jgi:hypothetical protein
MKFLFVHLDNLMRSGCLEYYTILRSWTLLPGAADALARSAPQAHSHDFNLLTAQ